MVMGVAVLFYLDKGIRGAKWLTETECEMLLTNLEGERRAKAHLSVAQTLRNPWVLLFSLIYFCISMGLYGVGFWLPQIIKNTGVKDALGLGLLAAIPYGCAAVAIILAGRSSDRTGERRWHFAICALAGGVGLILSTLFPSNVSAALAALGALLVVVVVPVNAAAAMAPKNNADGPWDRPLLSTGGRLHQMHHQIFGQQLLTLAPPKNCAAKSLFSKPRGCVCSTKYCERRAE
jgi:hypothetical protein